MADRSVSALWRGVILSIIITVFLSFNVASATEEIYPERNIEVISNGEMLSFDRPPLIVEGRTIVPLRTIAASLGFDTSWDGENMEVIIENDDTTVSFVIGQKSATVFEGDNIKSIALEQAAEIIDGRTYLPLRALAEIFGAEVVWNNETSTITIFDEMSAEVFKASHTYYFQNEAKWELPENGSGYCWVCSYAMVINDLVGNVTPKDVALVNEQVGGYGAYCHHFNILDAFGVRFTSAIDEESEYFDHYDATFGATYINNPDMDDNVAVEALKRALDKHPEGVLVRFEKYPHTIVAIGYIEDEIIFNDPEPSGWGGYSAEGIYSGVTFEKTYPAVRGLTLSDITFMQALEINE